MKKHPDCQPRRAVTMHRGNDDDGDDNQDFEGDGIDRGTPPCLKIRRLPGFHLQRTDTRVRKFRPTGFFPVRSH
jgi:hypothetical protein